MAPIEIARMCGYFIIGSWLVHLSLKNGRMFGFGCAIMIYGFPLRMGAALILGMSNRETGIISNFGVAAGLLSIAWDAYHDYKRIEIND